MTQLWIRAATAACTITLTLAGASAMAGATAAAGGSSVGISASSAGSASVKGSSNSIGGSSDSSSGKDKTAAIKDGDYRVAAVAPVPAQADKVRLSLEPQGIAQAEPFQLDVPLQVLGGQAPAVGEIVQARQRVYGVQFTRAAAPEPFLLVLADAWGQQLRSRPVTP